MTTALPPAAVTVADATATPIDVEQEFRRNYGRLLRIVMARLGNRQDAEDALQATFLLAWERQADYQPTEDITPLVWLMSLAKYEALQTLRQRSRCVPVGEWAEQFADTQPGRDTSTGLPCMADAQTSATVYAALVGLPEDQCNAVRLCLLEGVDRDGAARCLRIPPADVDWLTENAMRTLDRRFRAGTAAPKKVAPPARAGVSRAGVSPSSRLDPQVARLLTEQPELLDRLPSRQAEALRLRYLDGLTFSQLAARMGVVASGLHRTIGLAAQRIRDAAAGVAPRSAARNRQSISPHIQRLLDDPALLASLPPRWQQAIQLRYIDGLSQLDTARAMGSTIGAVETLVNKAMRRVRALPDAPNCGRIPTVDSRPGNPRVPSLELAATR